MRRVMTLPARSSLLGPAAAALLTAFLPAYGFAAAPCSGHKLLPKPRPQASCLQVLQQVYASPDKALRAVALPADVSLYATPDMESRVVIRTSTRPHTPHSCLLRRFATRSRMLSFALSKLADCAVAGERPHDDGNSGNRSCEAFCFLWLSTAPADAISMRVPRRGIDFQASMK